jgi:hypothetical protein
MPSRAAAKPSRVEHEVLRLTARTRHDAASDARLRQLWHPGIDWAYLLETAVSQGTVCLLHTHLDRLVASGDLTMPAEVLAELRSRHEGVAVRNLRLDAELRVLLREFERTGVEVLPYKGPVLAATMYGNLSLRMFADLDFLVRERDLAAAAVVLQSRGYAPGQDHSVSRQRRLRRLGHEESFVRPGERVELHWQVASRLYGAHVPLDAVWARRPAASRAHHATQGMSPEDLLVILCIHGCTHAWERLVWVADVAELLHNAQDEGGRALNWDLARRIATDAHVERRLKLGLLLASSWLDAPLPEAVRAWVALDRTVAKTATRVTRWFPGSPLAMRSIQFHLPLHDSLPDAVRFLMRALFTVTPADWSFVALPDIVYPLYAVVRPVRLIAGLAREWRWS